MGLKKRLFILDKTVKFIKHSSIYLQGENKMLRQIANKIIGRTKLMDENPSLEESLDLLDGLNGNTKGDISFDTGPFIRVNLKKIAPRDMVNFVRDKFREDKFDYTNIRHRVYSIKRGERHYLDLAHGTIEGEFGETVVKSKPYKYASIDFVVEKQK